MTRSLFSRLFLKPVLIATIGLTATAPALAGWNFLGTKQTDTLTAFKSEAELNEWLAAKKNRTQEQYQRRQKETAKMAQQSKMAESPAPVAMMAEEKSADMSSESESVTNTQTAGVDEGGIVKVHNNHLVILRRGRLFTVDIGNSRLSPTSVIDAYAPGSSGHAWYDEMLVSGNTVAVIGYSYSKGGTEIVLFNIDRNGQLSYRSTHVLRSNDYYSSRNYASRLIGDKLIFYTPLYINFYRDPLSCFPAVRNWEDGKAGEFQRIAPATQIYRTDEDLDPARTQIALHTVQVCDLSKPDMQCTATGVLAPAGREFYVSKDAVYIWTSPYARYNHRAAETAPPVSASVFRLPLDIKQAPTALKTMGSPIDQFSFLESSDGYLNVLLRSEGPAASMWSAEGGSKDLALLRVPVSQFGNGTQSAPLSHYHPLPSPSGGHAIQNRYIGDYLLYGAGNTWGRNHATESTAYALAWKTPQNAAVKISPEHSVDRIEALGKNALLVGTRNTNLVFTTIALGGTDRTTHANPISRFQLANAAQGETRSHGFFYKPDSEKSGILGLPFRGSGSSGWQQLRNVSSGIVYVKNHNLSLSEMGILGASPNPNTNDNCKASCVDWYGNARPLFVKGRVFALMGYELVEGKVQDKRITEVRRIDFSPVSAQPQRRP
ncbi:beta-propeller domain-containing protein [Oxalobacter sp. OttesenSCG-928-P03]|nr:beta-propeller domain-containing protein [Oxalobacter sp. OttesenSCG-928-P03]